MFVEYWICIFHNVKGPKNNSVSCNENFSVSRLKILSERYLFLFINYNFVSHIHRLLVRVCSVCENIMIYGLIVRLVCVLYIFDQCDIYVPFAENVFDNSCVASKAARKPP
jgi:hypothetical protein